MTTGKDKSLMRSLGEFVGHIWQGLRSDTGKHRREVRRETEEEQRETPMGKVTLRRTTIEEVEFDRSRRGKDGEDGG